MNLTIKRFKPGDIYYSDAAITNNDPAQGEVGTFKAVFGQCIFGAFTQYTMERLDTLIPAGTYEYDLYDSPANKCTVLRLTTDPEGNDITARELEHHPANYPYQLKGCCAHGTAIDIKTPMLLESKLAFNDMMTILGADTTTGTITYE